jgi:pyruvate-formate lyase-activating enzyme
VDGLSLYLKGVERMLRITEFIRETLEGKSYRPFNGVILIWNLTNGCNLYCKHCYSSANQERDQELTLEEIKRVADGYKVVLGKRYKGWASVYPDTLYQQEPTLHIPTGGGGEDPKAIHLTPCLFGEG